MLNQPTSSPMMTRMFGRRCCCCASAGTLAVAAATRPASSPRQQYLVVLIALLRRVQTVGFVIPSPCADVRRTKHPPAACPLEQLFFAAVHGSVRSELERTVPEGLCKFGVEA